MDDRHYLYRVATDTQRGLFASAVRIVLFVLSLAYGGFIRACIFLSLASKRKADCKVVSVGNMTVGGTGKTCVVEYIARALLNDHRAIAIISRGYGREKVSDAPAGSLSILGDEPAMLTLKFPGLPVIVDSRRLRAARRAVREHRVDTVVLDDGFQQWGIEKDLEVLTVNARRPLSNGHMLPRGLLREPLSSLMRADVIVFTHCGPGIDTFSFRKLLAGFKSTALIVESLHSPVSFFKMDRPEESLPLDSLRGKKVACLCGLGDPGAFEDTVRSLGITAEPSLRFPDHHRYSRQDLAEVFRRSRDKKAEAVVTTEKDAVKLHELPLSPDSLPVYVLRITLKVIKNEQAFLDRLRRIYSL